MLELLETWESQKIASFAIPPSSSVPRRILSLKPSVQSDGWPDWSLKARLEAGFTPLRSTAPVWEV